MLPSALLCSLAVTLPQDRVELWTEDVVKVAEELASLHPDPFRALPREEFEVAVDGLIGRLGELGDDEVAVELMRLVALPNLRGRDGHTNVLPTWFHVLPIQLYAFEDGWFVVGVRASEGADLVGAELRAIGGRPIEEVASAIAPLVTRDNDSNLRAKLPLTLSMVEVLATLGLVGADGRASLALRAPDGRELQASLAGIPIRDVMHARGAAHLLPERPGLRGFRGREQAWWMEVVPEARALYVQFNQVAASGPEDEPVGELGARIARTFDAEHLERVVLDLRWNGGGDNTTFGPLIDALKGHSGLDREGVLFALVGRATFSAAGNLVTVLERDTRATLVGEPTGGAPNQYGDSRPIALAHHHELLVFVSTRYHAFGGTSDARLTHEPDVALPPRAADYFAGRDPALDRALGLTAD